MNNEGPSTSPYAPPKSNLSDSPGIDGLTPSAFNNIDSYRKSLIPKWIKFFGWLFIVFGCLIPVVALAAVFTGGEGEFSFYGIETSGSIFAFAPLFVFVLYILHGICAYGLLFAEPWGVDTCIALGYLSVLVCFYTMFAGMYNGNVELRLELLLLIPYLIKLHKLKPVWLPEESIEAEAQ